VFVRHATQHKARHEDRVNEVFIGNFNAVRHEHLGVKAEVVPDQLLVPQGGESRALQRHPPQVDDERHGSPVNLCRYLK
jgi:hypothetical protein